MLHRDTYTDKGYLFTKDNGDMMFVDTISTWIIKFLKRKNLPLINFHGLRHTAASILIDSGVTLKTVSEILGHSRGSTTIDIYSHMLQGSDDAAAQIMENRLCPKSANNTTVNKVSTNRNFKKIKKAGNSD
jgi:integrase